MAKIVTLKERKTRALAARRAAHDRLLPRLADEAARYGGRYILFGSAARGELRANSDVDLLADFPRSAPRRRSGRLSMPVPNWVCSVTSWNSAPVARLSSRASCLSRRVLA